MPTNTSAATATLITSLPYTITDATSGAAPSLWWKWIGTTDPNVLGAWAQTSAFLSVIVFSPNGTTQLPHTSTWNTVSNRPVQWPVSDGITYYINIKATFGHAGATGSFTLSVLPALHDDAPIGSIWVNDDTENFPLAFLSGTDGSVLQFVHPVGAGECADVLPSGKWLLHNAWASDHLELYSPAGALLVDLNYGPVSTGDKPIRSNKSNAWYVGKPIDVANASHATVTTVTEAGAFGPTTWTMPIAGMAALSPSLDETILYYVHDAVNTTSAVHRWDLVNNVALSDLVGSLGLRALNDNIQVLADDTILSGYRVDATNTRINRYNAAGTLLNTYNFTGVRASATPKIATALDDPVSFWVWNKLATGYSQFQQIRTSDGAVLVTLGPVLFELGRAEVLSDPTSPTRFGHSESCTFFLTRASTAPIPPITGTIASTTLTGALTGYILPPRHLEALCRGVMTLAALSPDARQRIINALGTVSPGCLLYTYESGTTTNLATYSDAALTVALPNPIVADSSGLFPAIYLLSQAYSFVLRNSLGELIWQADPVQDVGALLQSTLTTLQTTVTALGASSETKFCTTAFSQANSATLANIIGLTGFTLAAAGVYKFDINLSGTAGASGGVKYAFKYTSASLTNLEATGIGNTASAVATQHTTTTTDQTSLYAQTAAVLFTRITGRITVNAAGTLAIQAAQNASDGTATTVAVGSWATFQKIS